MDLDHIDSILTKHKGNHGSLIAILEEAQAFYGYLPENVLRAIAEKTGRTMVDVYGVATFYRGFSLKPRGKHIVSVCLGTACHVQGGPQIAEELSKQLDVKPGETTADREFTLEVVNCLGACALGPVVVVDGHYFSKVKTSQVASILSEAREGLGQIAVDTDQRIFPIDVSCARCNHSLMDERHPVDGHPSIKVTLSFNNKHGWLALSCLYGSDKVESEFEIPHDSVVNMFCPHCNAELIGAGLCLECGEAMVPMIVSGGGVVQICTRRGCHGHLLDLGGFPLE